MMFYANVGLLYVLCFWEQKKKHGVVLLFLHPGLARGSRGLHYFIDKCIFTLKLSAQIQEVCQSLKEEFQVRHQLSLYGRLLVREKQETLYRACTPLAL